MFGSKNNTNLQFNIVLNNEAIVLACFMQNIWEFQKSTLLMPNQHRYNVPR